MARQPSVKVNGYEIGDHPFRRIVWAETEGLLEATKQAPWQAFETFSGPGRNHAGDMDYPVRRLSIVVRITKQDGFLSKHEALAVLSEIFSGQPAIVQVGSLYLESEFSPPQIQKDAWKLTSGYLTVRFDGEAIPGTYFGEYGYQQGRAQGIIVQDDRPDHPGLIFTGNAFTVHNPGTAPTEAVVSVTNTSLPNTTVYLLGTKGQMMPVNLDATGYGRIDEAYGFLLYPGTNVVKIVDASGALIATGTFSTCFYGTRFRHIGNTDNRFADGPVFQHARTGPATYLSPDGTLKTAGDGVARVGVPTPIARRNLIANSNNFKSPQNSIFGGSGGSVTDNFGVFDGDPTSKVSLTANATFRTSITLTTGVAYEVSFWARRISGSSRLTLDLRDGAIKNLDLTDTMTRHVLTLTAGSSGGVDMWASQGAIDFELRGLQVEPVLSPYQPTKDGSVDYSHPLNGAGLVLEGASTNLLTANQSNVETDTSGFSGSDATYLSGTSTLARSSVQKYEGSYSLAVTTPGGAASEGVVLSGATGRPANTAHTWSGMAFIPAGVTVNFLLRDNTNGITGAAFPLVGNGGWQFFSCSVTTGVSTATLIPIARTASQVATTFYLDALKLEANPFPTSWHLGGTTRQPDLVGIVPPHNLLKWSEALDNAYWLRDANITPSPAIAGGRTCFKIDKSAAIGSRALRANVTVEKSGPLTFSLPLLAGSRSKATLRLYNVTKSANAAASKVVDLSASEWRRHSITTTTHPSAGDVIQVIIYPDDSDSAANTGYVYANMAALVEGSHPGIYVPTTDTPILPPPSPALDPAWSQNGRVRFRVLPPPISTGKHIGYLGAFDGISRTYQEATLCLARSSSQGLTGYQLIFERRHSGGSQVRGAVFPNVQAFWDGAPHDVILEWTNEINEQTGVREMWQRLYIDGVLVAQQNVAALYGATAWADIDPSRLISDGNVSAVLSRISLDYPAPRPGYRQVA